MIGKNQEFELEITDLSEDGLGIGRKDGFVWFVKDSAIGDRVRVSAMKVKKRYGFARLRSVLRPSRDRVESPCPISRRCGENSKVHSYLLWSKTCPLRYSRTKGLNERR